MEISRNIKKKYPVITALVVQGRKGLAAFCLNPCLAREACVHNFHFLSSIPAFTQTHISLEGGCLALLTVVF